ncbi:MAG TPA: alpha/beta hydrolase [Gemmatimonadales bacterium]|nr:alpha/beta hydrolase [Gemmatimonadales bacterium]
MVAVRLALGLALAFGLLVFVAWRAQERLAFPAPRARVPDPKQVGVANGERVELVAPDGARLVGWYLAPSPEPSGDARPARTVAPPARAVAGAPALLWFYGNGENVGAIWPIVREFQPPGTAVLVIDYPGYGASSGRATEAGLYRAADAAYAALVARSGVDARRVYAYGRSLGSAAATYVAARYPVAGLILESPFTDATAMARRLYPILPRFIVRLSLDNLGRIAAVRCPVLVFHGDADRLVPLEMGMAVAAAAPGPAELVVIHGAGHNETYERGGRAYRDKVWEFVRGPRPTGSGPTGPK